MSRIPAGGPFFGQVGAHTFQAGNSSLVLKDPHPNDLSSKKAQKWYHLHVSWPIKQASHNNFANLAARYGLLKLYT